MTTPTERLYYTDPHLIEFDARVIEVRDVDGRAGLVLDRTAFYPTSGGQPFDTGTLGTTRVVDVVDQDDGTILHIVQGQPETPVAGTGGGQPAFVSGRIDWERRFDHMQQHTGQHVLSAAFDRTCGARTLSFHLGSAAATIDLSREVSAAEIADAEDAANRVVWEDRPVTIRFVDAQDAAALPLRKESARTGTLRIIDVEGFDVSACGGTHVARTGAIGIIATGAAERFRGGSRIEFRCGVRALRSYRTLRDTAGAAAKLLSAGVEELPQGIERVQSENKDVRRRVKELEERLAVYQADVMVAMAEDRKGIKVVIESVPDLDINGLKTIAQRIVARPDHVVALLTTAPPFSLLIARSGGVPLDASAILKQLTGKFGGKGGGRAELAQGGGLTGNPAEILEAARSAVLA